MINKIENIKYKEIKRISPSQFYSMKNCAYKAVLAEAYDRKPLLPLSPDTYFGTVLHKILELISKGIIKNEYELNVEFNKQVISLENELQQKGYGFFVPLKIKLRNFGLKKIQLRKYLRTELEQKTGSSSIKFYSEKWFESQDKLIAGKFDLIIENTDSIEIIDFKTGAITQDHFDDESEVNSDIKSEYKDQLRLYAYLYFDNNKKFPNKLSLVNLTKQKFSVKFSEEECKTLFEEAKRLLKSTNDNINVNSFVANPKEENCKYCLYRPACSFFHKMLETNFSLNDVSGFILDVKKFQNGNVSLYLQNGNKVISIKNFKNDNFDELSSNKNKLVKIYNLRRELTELAYSVTDTTMIYE